MDDPRGPFRSGMPAPQRGPDRPRFQCCPRTLSAPPHTGRLNAASAAVWGVTLLWVRSRTNIPIQRSALDTVVVASIWGMKAMFLRAACLHATHRLLHMASPG